MSDAVRDALLNPVDPPADGYEPANDDGGDDVALPPIALPDDCPVTPVGTENNVFYFITALGELRALTADKVANKHIVGMFAPEAKYLKQTWPRKTTVPIKTPEGKILKDENGNTLSREIITGWRNDDVAMLLMDCAAREGVWNAREKVRGRGCWVGDDGSLILHAGNRVYLGGKWRRPNMYDGMVYTTAPPIPKPAPDEFYHGMTADRIAPGLTGSLRAKGVTIAADASPAVLLLEFLRTWRFARPHIDPLLLLGWIGAALYGGALDYRPLAWLTGDMATGKTTLQKALGWLLDGGILQSPNATEAGVRSVLGQQSLPVAIDEAEAGHDNSRILALVTLARLAASSQGSILRGSQDQTGHEFRAETCFLFSSILVPPITPADRSRMAMLELETLPAGQRAPRLDKRELAAIGAWLRRRAAERWPHWPATLEAFSDAMIDYGEQGGRAVDQFGTLRAAAHVLLHDGMPEEEELAEIGRQFHVERFAETAGLTSNAMQCVEHLATSQVQLDRGGQPKSVAHWIAAAAESIAAGLDGVQLAEVRDRRKRANDALANVGMRVIVAGKRDREPGDERPVPVPGREYLAVASAHQALNRLFTPSDWTQNNWAQALRRIPGAVADQQRIDHGPRKCTMVPIEAVVAIVAEDVGADEEQRA